ncbi:uncharacterized protein [Dipodomys merriami]|uniref:uncharacterized protein n=1 Tax=Dipodomys merriami TaxID=94247 RepID=UPI00384CC31C
MRGTGAAASEPALPAGEASPPQSPPAASMPASCCQGLPVVTARCSGTPGRASSIQHSTGTGHRIWVWECGRPPEGVLLSASKLTWENAQQTCSHTGVNELNTHSCSCETLASSMHRSPAMQHLSMQLYVAQWPTLSPPGFTFPVLGLQVIWISSREHSGREEALSLNNILFRACRNLQAPFECHFRKLNDLNGCLDCNSEVVPSIPISLNCLEA